MLKILSLAKQLERASQKHTKKKEVRKITLIFLFAERNST